MNETPTVTIGLPVFNGQDYLPEAIDSLLSQSYQDFELIISDNHSSDATESICREYAQKDSRIKYHRQAENLGAIRNFNFVFEPARGKYFKWASHDDVCDHEYLGRCVEYLDAHPNIVWCHCDSDMIDADGVSWLDRLPCHDEEITTCGNGQRRWKGLPREHHDSTRPSQRFAGVLLGTRWCVDSYGLIRAASLRQTRMLVDLYGAEKVLMGELSLQGPTYQIPEVLFQQRIHSGASSYEDDSTAQQQFASARYARPFTSTRLSLLFAHLGAIRHAQLSVWERLCCYGVLLRYVMQVGKWGRVFGRLLKHQSVGGGGRRIIEAASGDAVKAP